MEEGTTLICIEPKVLHGYYNSKFNGETLRITSAKVPYITKMPHSQYFAILSTGKRTEDNEEIRFSVSLHELNTKNFIIV